MNLFALSALLNTFSSLIFGFFVFLKDRKNRVFQLWLALSLSFVLWEFSAYNIAITTDKQLAFLWWRIAHIGVILIPVFFTNFIYAWLKIKRKAFYYFSWVFAVSFSAINLYDLFIRPTGLFIANMRWVFNSFYYDSPPGLLYPIFVALWIFMVLFSHYELLRIYKDSTGARRSQIQYFIFAFVVAYAGGSTCYLPVFGIDFYPYFNFVLPFYTIIMTYAIVVHRLMDIKLVMRRYSVFLASLSVVLILATAVKYFFESWFYDYSVWADPLILIGAIYVFTPIKNYFYRLANKYFFSSLYDSAEVIASLSDKLRTTLEAGKIYEFISQALMGAFHAKAIGLLIYDEKAGSFTVQYNNGFNIGSRKNFPEDKDLNENYIKRNLPVITEDVRRLSRFDDNQTVALLKKLGVEILAPLNVKDKIIGLIALGAKESGDMYNEEDLKVLEVAGAQTAIALENALLYKETKNFSIKLEKEVEKATHDLKKANVQLKKLDAAKSEFISIASHQLRTPLTVIKGYISMMLEGNFGGLTKPESESLEKVFESNERLIQLVENLLNISRIESGRLQFNYQQVDMNKMVASVKEELEANAKRKGLILQYRAPTKSVPIIKIDDEKIRQVVMNLVDNGIKYTKHGSVTVKLEQAENKIRFSVTDSGVGIRPEDMGNLFKKFSRGSGISLIHTEGTGLGLYVARMMIEAHHGKIWAESAGVGKGSKFCFELPVK